MSNKKILIVEDRKSDQNELASKLNNAGFLTAVSSTSEDALGKIKSEPFDLLILDVVMDELSGFSFLAHLESLKFAAPIVAVSDFGEEECLMKAHELGVKECFIKSDSGIIEKISLLLA